MKRFLLLLAIVISIVSCSKDDSSTTLVGDWVSRNDFRGVARNYAVTFTINDKAYIIGGASYNYKQYWHNDVWEYDPDNYTWIRKDSLPKTCALRTGAVGFSIGNKGYYGTGYDNDYNRLNDFWIFDPSADAGKQWTKHPDGFKGSARYGATAFAVNGKGYIIGGYDESTLMDTWEFDPTVGAYGTWTEITGTHSYPGPKRMNGLAFVIGTKAYVCTGINNSYLKDLWEFDAATNIWTEKNKIYNYSDESFDDDYSIIREFGSAFVIDSKAYVTCGQSSSLLTDTWEYDPTTDLWAKKSYFEGSARTKAAAFSVKNKGFILTGSGSTSATSNSYYDDIWEFHPNDESNTDNN
jgi:N-acetylneuraminic acid mutarotase